MGNVFEVGQQLQRENQRVEYKDANLLLLLLRTGDKILFLQVPEAYPMPRELQDSLQTAFPKAEFVNAGVQAHKSMLSSRLMLGGGIETGQFRPHFSYEEAKSVLESEAKKESELKEAATKKPKWSGFFFRERSAETTSKVGHAQSDNLNFKQKK